MILFRPNRFIEFQLFECVDFIFQFLKRTDLSHLGDENKQKSNSLIQVHTLIVLFICWPVRADKVVEPNNEMKSLASDVNGLEGEPLHPSALPKDIASLNVAR